MFVLLKNYDSFEKSSFLYVPDFNADIERILIELYYRDVAEGLVETTFTTLPMGESAMDICDWLYTKRKENNGYKTVALLDSLETHLTKKLEKI